MSIKNCSAKSKSFKVIYFFFENQKLKALEKTSQFCFSFLSFITLFQLLVGYVWSGNFSFSLLGLRIVRLPPKEKPKRIIINLLIQVFFMMPEYTSDVDGMGVLRLLEAIRIVGLDKIRFHK